MSEREMRQDPGTEMQRQRSQSPGQNLQQEQSTAERAGQLLSQGERQLQAAHEKLSDLEEQRTKLQASPNADPKQIDKLDSEIERQDRLAEALESRNATLERIERLSPNAETRLAELADRLLQQIEQDRDLTRWTASLDAQGKAFEAPTLRSVQDALQQDQADQALKDVQALVDDFQSRGYATEAMSMISQVLEQDQDAGAKQEQLKGLLEAFAKEGLMRMESLEESTAQVAQSREREGQGRTIADVPELAAVWELARDRAGSPEAGYPQVRSEFWELLNPRSETPGLGADEASAIEAGRKLLEAAGYTFEASQPGRAPRLVADHPLSRNDYTLSLQHDFPQYRIKMAGGDLDRLLTDPDNLRFTTARDNLQEDAVRFGRARGWMAEIERQAEAQLGAIENVVAESRKELSAAERKDADRLVKDANRLLSDVRSRLSNPREWERRALDEAGASQFESIRDLRTRYAVEERRLIEARDRPAPTDHKELAKQQDQEREISRRVGELDLQVEAAQAEFGREAQAAMTRLREELRQLGKRKDSDGWIKVRRQIEERLAELESESGLPPKR